MEEISDLIHRLRGYLVEAKPLDRESTLEDPSGVAEWAAKRVGFYGYGSDELLAQASRVENVQQCAKVLVECLAALPKPAEQPEPEPQPGDLLDPADVALMLGKGVDAIYKWCSEGFLKASNVNDGGKPRWKIKREDLDAFLESRQREPVVSQPRRSRIENGVNRY